MTEKIEDVYVENRKLREQVKYYINLLELENTLRKTKDSYSHD
jgi:hypothetical protein|tara:strand:- start:478 stop:606 length:129 start_codon:yes stop_codon:yes gene_type:complete